MLVSIGMPVYNSERSISKAIESIISQDYKNFELIISDNASTDRTQEICKSFEMMDPRIKYYRQDYTLSAELNFKFVLLKSSGEFFMWAAGDDTRTSGFISTNLNQLLKYPNSIASTSPNNYRPKIDHNDNIVKFEMCGNKKSRFRQFFRNANFSHGIFYSLIRINIIKSCPWVGDSFFANDWAVVLYLANQGEIHRTDTELITFSTQGQSNQSNVNEIYGLHGITRVAPFLIFTKKFFLYLKVGRSKMQLLFIF